MNNLKGAFSMSDERTGLLTFEVDEATLDTHKIKKTGRMSRQNATSNHTNHNDNGFCMSIIRKEAAPSTKHVMFNTYGLSAEGVLPKF